MLATCQVKIPAIDGNYESVRLLIDPGSELSFITAALVKRLGVARQSASIPLLGIGGIQSGRTKGVVTIELHSTYDYSTYCTIQTYILPHLTCKLPSYSIETESWSHIRGLQLADPSFDKPGPVHLILGADSYGQILKPNIILGTLQSPVAQNTIFGWVLSGPVATSTDLIAATSYHCSVNRDLQDLLTKFWKQEEIPTSSLTLSPDDAKCEEHFGTTFSRNQEGRYIVKLPLKSPATTLGNSTARALRCLSRLCRRFENDSSYQKQYSEFIQEYLSLGHMTLVPNSEVNSTLTFYLPHHGVLRESSRTTKLRVVFNGSSRTSTGVSLNIFYSGPKLQTEISDVLLWFRIHRFVFSTDITKMYRQIQIHPEDSDLQRIFWHGANKQLLHFRLTTVTYA